MYGWTGNDTLDGSAGNDYLYGEYGSDVLYGSFGHDILIGGDEHDILYGEFGRDVLDGGNGNDYLDGGDDNDYFYGGAGSDYLFGGAGNDTLLGFNYGDGGIGQFDTLVGGSGADQFYLGSEHYGYNYLGDGYAVIADFNRYEGDKLIMKGSTSYSGGSGNYGVGTAALDTGIYLNGNLIAVLQDVSGSGYIMSRDTLWY